VGGGIASLRRIKMTSTKSAKLRLRILVDGWDDVVEGDTMEMFSSERI